MNSRQNSVVFNQFFHIFNQFSDNFADIPANFIDFETFLCEKWLQVRFFHLNLLKYVRSIDLTSAVTTVQNFKKTSSTFVFQRSLLELINI